MLFFLLCFFFFLHKQFNDLRDDSKGCCIYKFVQKHRKPTPTAKHIRVHVKRSKMHPVPEGLPYFYSTDFIFIRMFHSSKQFDATNLCPLAFGRSIYSAHKVLKYSDSCSRKQLHVYKYLQVQYEINETSQTSLYQCKKKKKKVKKETRDR